jgi:hypothetical protein
LERKARATHIIEIGDDMPWDEIPWDEIPEDSPEYTGISRNAQGVRGETRGALPPIQNVPLWGDGDV